MLNNFCFHVYAQKSLIIDENGNDLEDYFKYKNPQKE